MKRGLWLFFGIRGVVKHPAPGGISEATSRRNGVGIARWRSVGVGLEVFDGGEQVVEGLIAQESRGEEEAEVR
jgi:hypothetical protein